MGPTAVSYTHLDGLYADAGNAKAQAEALQAQYDARLKAANAEGDRIIQKATRQAQEREEAIVHEAQEKAARTMERAHAQMEQEKKQAMNDLKDQVSGMALGIASAVLEEDVDKRKPVSYTHLDVYKRQAWRRSFAWPLG